MLGLEISVEDLAVRHLQCFKFLSIWQAEQSIPHVEHDYEVDKLKPFSLKGQELKISAKPIPATPAT